MPIGDDPKKKSEHKQKSIPGLSVRPSTSSASKSEQSTSNVNPSANTHPGKALTPNPKFQKTLTPRVKSEPRLITRKQTRSVTQGQQSRSKMALNDFIAASDRLSQFEAILATAPLTTPTLSSLKIRREQVQNIWARVEQEYGLCSKALRGDASPEEASKTSDLKEILAKYSYCYAVYERCASQIWRIIFKF